MLNLGWHRDTYVEEYHRAFPNRYASGRNILKCRISDEHIGGLATVPALFAAHPHPSPLQRPPRRRLPHPPPSDISNGTPLRKVRMTAA